MGDWPTSRIALAKGAIHRTQGYKSAQFKPEDYKEVPDINYLLLSK